MTTNGQFAMTTAIRPWPIGYFPDQFQPPKHIILLARGDAKPLQPTDRIDEWQSDDEQDAEEAG